MGMQAGYTQYNCFLCQWRSRDTNQYSITGCVERDQHLPGYQNILIAPLIEKADILLPPLHVKLGLYKNFIKLLKSNQLEKERLRVLFPKLSDAKLNAGVLNGPDIRRLSKDVNFEVCLTPY